MDTCVITSPGAAAETSQAIPDAIPTLVFRAKGGNREAFATLYELHKKQVYLICLGLAGDVAEAEILTQDAFMRAFRGLAAFRGNSLFSTWLYRIAVNTALTTVRIQHPPQVSLDEPIPWFSCRAARGEQG